MSVVIKNKNKNKIQPKANARRVPASESHTPSIRGSQEPSRISETPQPTAVDVPPTISVVVDDTAHTTDIIAHTNNARNGNSELTTGIAKPVDARPITVVETHINPSETGNPQQHDKAPLPIATTTTRLITPLPTQASTVASGRSTDSDALDEEDTSHAEGQGDEPTPATSGPSAVGNANNSLRLPTPEATQPPAPVSQETETGTAEQPTQEEGANALLQLSQADARTRSSRRRASTRGNASESERRNGRGRAEEAEDAPRDEVVSKPVRRTKATRKRKSPVPESAEPAETSDNDVIEARPSKRPRVTKQKEAAKKTKTPKIKTSRTKATATATPKPRTSKRRGAEDDVEAEAPVPKAARRKRKSKGAVPETAEDENDSDSSEASSKRGREATPENAETTVIDQETTTMSKLPNLRIGALGERERKLREREEEKKAKEEADRELAARAEALGDEEPAEDDKELIAWLKRDVEAKELKREQEEEKQRIFNDEQEWSHKPSGRYGAGRKKRQEEDLEPEAEPTADNNDDNDANTDINDYRYEDPQGPLPTIIDKHGAMVTNPDAAITQPLEIVEVTEENVDDISKKVNYGSYRHKERVFSWTEEAVDKLFEGLSIFGTDFGMIATIIPGSSRMQVKKKFEKMDRIKEFSVLITQALHKKNRKRITVAEIEEVRGKKLVDPEEFDRETRKREDAMRKEKEHARKEAEEQMRNRGRDPVQNGDNANGVEEGEDEVIEERLEPEEEEQVEDEIEDEIDDEQFDNAVREAQAAQEAEPATDEQPEVQAEDEQGVETSRPNKNDAQEQEAEEAPENDNNEDSIENGNADVAVNSIEENVEPTAPATRGRKAGNKGNSARGRGRGRGRGKGR